MSSNAGTIPRMARILGFLFFAGTLIILVPVLLLAGMAAALAALTGMIVAAWLLRGKMQVVSEQYTERHFTREQQGKENGKVTVIEGEYEVVAHKKGAKNS